MSARTDEESGLHRLADEPVRAVPVRTVVVEVQLDDASMLAVRIARDVAKTFKRPMTVLHVVRAGAVVEKEVARLRVFIAKHAGIFLDRQAIVIAGSDSRDAQAACARACRHALLFVCVGTLDARTRLDGAITSAIAARRPLLFVSDARVQLLVVRQQEAALRRGS